ncbi:NAD(P)/FAD-dependent oxidoreductase [Rubrobacter taiwanensis]|uniref:NADH:ubiquinone reductase (non-electrogenic) n=1 Tax=Rubrobacter taiwanensis TaxID=185139 RepID=A0A4R1BI45_9ACTN|nr:NAD(P)/FAD-dependent oxidoreductase [Rubrobacter taiwanensis]TCJ16818.1 NAD(P)/FAD-dependent oxidoreductase [Rubrobacter taiwanensis]
MGKLLKAGLAAGGTVAAARLLRRAFRSEPRYAPWEKPPYRDFPNKVLIAGGGFAGYTVARDLCELTRDREDVGVMVISRENFLTFWPMVPEVIANDIDAQNIAQPLRRSLIRAGASFRRAEVESVDFDRRCVRAGGQEFPYDHLVLALGGQPNFFGIPGVEEHSLTMKGLSDAMRIRNRMIERFEEATLARGDVPDSRLTFVIIGGGATGVETAAQLHSLVHHALAPDYPNINPHRVRIILIEAADEILQELDPALRRVARAKLVERRIEVLTKTAAQEVTGDRVILNNGDVIRSENVIWTAGGRPNAKLRDLDLPLTKLDGVIVDRYLRVQDRENVWALGDCAAIPGRDGKYVPPTAQAATQEGHVLARNILAAIDGAGELEEFEYRPLGQLVELGANFAVNEVMGVKFSGLLAALFWRAVYLTKLKSPQNRLRVVLDWVLHAFYRPATTQIRGLG